MRAREAATLRSLEGLGERLELRTLDPWRRIALGRAVRSLDTAERLVLEEAASRVSQAPSSRPRGARSGAQRIRLYRLRARLKVVL
jgi:hypothetical protein